MSVGMLLCVVLVLRSVAQVFHRLRHHLVSLLVPLGTASSFAFCTSSAVLGAAKRVGGANISESDSSSIPEISKRQQGGTRCVIISL